MVDGNNHREREREKERETKNKSPNSRYTGAVLHEAGCVRWSRQHKPAGIHHGSQSPPQQQAIRASLQATEEKERR